MNTQSMRSTNLARTPDQRMEHLIAKHTGLDEIVEGKARVTGCLANGYAPLGYLLADFTLIRHQGTFHLFHIPRVPGHRPILRCHEHWIGHAVSQDLDTWTTLNPALCVEPSNHFESGHVWAPFVIEHEGVHCMFYTGLSDEPSQSICLAVARDPDLASWERSAENPITPLEGFDWHWRNRFGHARHARDPHVVRVGDHFLLAYTTMHADGCPAVGGLVSTDMRKWEDIGPMLFRPVPPASWHPESVNIQPLPDGTWTMIPSATPGLEYYISTDPYHWHGLTATPIRYADESTKPLVGIEVLARDDEAGLWVVAYFEGNGVDRLFIGTLDLHESPWTLRRVRSAPELDRWQGLLG